MIDEAFVPIPVRVHPGDLDTEGWADARRLAGAAGDPGSAVQSALQGLVDSLGLPGTVQLQVGVPSPSGRLGVVVGERLLGYPRALLDRTVGRATDAGEFARDLPELVTEIVKRHAPALLVPDVVRAYLRAADAEIEGQEAAGHEILKDLVARGLSLADRASIGRGLRDGAALGLPDEEIAELLFARLRPQDLDVCFHPGYAPALLGEEIPPQGALSVRRLAPPTAESFDLVGERLLAELGIRMPSIRIAPRLDLPPDTFTFRINHRTGALWRGLAPNQRLANATTEQLSEWGVPHRPCVNPINGVVCGIVALEDAPAVEAHGVHLWDPLGFLLIALSKEVERRAGDLIDAQLVEHELAHLEPLLPQLTGAALGRISAARLTAVLRLILDGGVPIRDLRRILESVLAFDYVVADGRSRIVLDERLVLDRPLLREPVESVERLARHVRKGLRRAITQRFSAGTGNLPVFLLDHHTIEQPIFRHLATMEGEGGDPHAAGLEGVLGAIRQVLAEPPDSAVRPTALASGTVAEFLRGRLGPEFPDSPILGYEDLAPEANLRIVSRVSME